MGFMRPGQDKGAKFLELFGNRFHFVSVEA
jgi:hypothetical protein